MHKENQKKPKLVAAKKEVIKIHSSLQIAHPHAAGIDAGDTEFSVAVRIDDGSFEVSEYGSFTQDLDKIVCYLKSKDITTVAIESTGVYYVALYLKLEAAGIEPYLVNARHAKNVTGRKKDDTDAIWLQKLHCYGLLQKSFQPSDDGRAFRDLVRLRKISIRNGADYINLMQKALELMNIKVHVVISDITGKTGMSIVRAILNGEQDAVKLAGYADGRIKASKQTIIASLEGIWRPEHLLALKQAYDGYQFFQQQVAECDQQIKILLDKQVSLLCDKAICDGLAKEDKKPAGKGLKKVAKKNQYQFSIRPYMRALLGVDLCEIPGISEITAAELIAEIGTDINQWANEKRFTGWLNLCPNTKISGGKIISSRMMKKKNHAGLCLRMAATTVARMKTPMGDYYRRMKSKMGGKGAAVATANKMAKIIYTILKNKEPYDSSLYAAKLEKFKENQIRYLEQKLQRLKTA